ncbi:hypothetical protein D3C72_1747730 [compost metagenome]
MRGGVDADGEGDQPGEDDGDEGDEDRQPEPVADDGADGQLVFEGIAEIALQHTGEPMDISQQRRLIEAIFLPQRFDLLHVDAFALRPDLCDIALEIVAGRQLDDGEDERRNDEQGRNHRRDTPENISQHVSLPVRSRRCRVCRHRNSTWGRSRRAQCRARSSASLPRGSAGARR